MILSTNVKQYFNYGCQTKDGFNKERTKFKTRWLLWGKSGENNKIGNHIIQVFYQKHRIFLI